MALIGINTTLHAVLFDDILSVNFYSSFPGMCSVLSISFVL